MRDVLLLLSTILEAFNDLNKSIFKERMKKDLVYTGALININLNL